MRLWLEGPGATFVGEDPAGADLDGVGRAEHRDVRDPRPDRRARRRPSGGAGRLGRCSPRSPTQARACSCPRRTSLVPGVHLRVRAHRVRSHRLRRRQRCVERLTIELPFEQYLRGLGEMPAAGPMAALRAQAVARADATRPTRSGGTGCAATATAISSTARATRSTWAGARRAGSTATGGWPPSTTTGGRGRHLQRRRRSRRSTRHRTAGTPRTSRTCGTAGTPPTRSHGCRGVCDPGESTTANPWTDWTRGFTASSVSSRLAPYTGGDRDHPSIHRRRGEGSRAGS